MKKVLIIEASPRNGYCKRTGNYVAEQLQDRYELDFLSISELNINQCKGCAVCLYLGSSKCPLRDDDTIRILEKMTWADGVIFIVPNYALGVPALLKNLFDRLAYLFHRPRLFNKVCLPIVVQGVIGGKKIANYINEVMGYWGMIPIKGAVITGGVYLNKAKSTNLEQKDNQIIRVALERFAKEVNRKSVKTPTFIKLIIFRMVRTSIKYGEEALPPDKAYYERMGWFDANYYYNVKLNKFKKIVGRLLDGIAKRMFTK